MEELCWYEGLEDPPFLGLCPTEDGAAGYEGFVATFEDALSLVRAFQNVTSTHFVIVKQKKSAPHGSYKVGEPVYTPTLLALTKEAADFDKHKVFWEEPKRNVCKGPLLEFDGVPFVIKSSTMLECQYGRDRHIARKRKATKDLEPGTVIGSRVSRKQNCTAAVFIREICRFPQFRISTDSPKRRFHQAKKLRRAMTDPSTVMSETRIYVRLPRMETHSNHPAEEATMCQPVDPQVKAFVREQINAGVNTVAALQQITEKFIEHELFHGKPAPLRHDRRFFPGRRYFTNMLYRSRHSPSGNPDDTMEIMTAKWESSSTTIVDMDVGETIVLINSDIDIQLDCESTALTEAKVMSTTAARCRNVLNQLLDLTYRCNDVAHLEALEQRLRVAHLEFLAGSQSDTGTIVQVPLVGRWESVEQCSGPPQKRIRVHQKSSPNL